MPASAARAASSTGRGAGAPGWPTSMWITRCPARSRSTAAANTSMAMNGATDERRDGWKRDMADLSTDGSAPIAQPEPADDPDPTRVSPALETS